MIQKKYDVSSGMYRAEHLDTFSKVAKIKKYTHFSSQKLVWGLEDFVQEEEKKKKTKTIANV